MLIITRKDIITIMVDFQILLIEQISLIASLGKREVQKIINNLYKKK